ncbi:MAG: hypothetical protein EA360_11235 [Balneolaceae bacterium]|nr:MAG: hypothetical protein EA360_11235 [Balneolaceae bacterium]
MKHKIVELLGPSGIGKSALYHELRKRWKPNEKWVSFDDIFATPKQFPGTYVRTVFRPLKKAWEEPYDYSRSLKNYNIWDQLDGYSNPFLFGEYGDFFHTVMDLVERHCRVGYSGEDKRFQTFFMIMWSVGQLNTVLELEGDDRLFLMKDGEMLLSRIMHLNSPSFDEDALFAYLKVVPKPEALIRLVAPADQVVKRIKKRGRVASLHLGMDDETIYKYTSNTLEMLAKACEELKEKGVPVLEVDAEKEIKENAQHIIEFFEEVMEVNRV